MFIRRENFKQYVTLYPVITTLLAINIIVYFLTLLPEIGDEIVWRGISYNLLITHGEWWRLVTSLFLHGGFTHILFNMFSLFVFGPELERMLGKGRFLLVYFVAGIAGNVITYFIQDWQYASLGASGAIYGIFGVFGALVYLKRNSLPQLKQVILPMIIVGVIMTFISSNINITAHLGGLGTGFVLGLYFFRSNKGHLNGL